VKCGDQRQRGRYHRPDAGQGKRDESDICFPFEGVDRQLGRNEPLQLRSRDFPVHEQKVMPLLVHQNRPTRFEGGGNTISNFDFGHA